VVAANVQRASEDALTATLLEGVEITALDLVLGPGPASLSYVSDRRRRTLALPE
jgi:hypothetical protein